MRSAPVAVLTGVTLGVLAACSDVRPRPDAGTSVVTVHPAGILVPESPDFHGKELKNLNWDFATCASCHGSDFSGGSAKVSCLKCHADGPTACTTCHGSGPTTNAHLVHRQVAKLDCSECHVVPAHWNDEGHILAGGVAITTPAKVTFGARAGLTIDPGDRSGPPTFENGKCSNVYCHGDALHATGGTAREPRWDDPTPSGGCTGCHGKPPTGHARSDCATCHVVPTQVTDPGHIDGVVQVGRVPGCSGCHGDATSPAPPTDLQGNTQISAIGVGAHRAHLTVPSGLRGPIPCATCHVVPTQVDDPGHIDSLDPAEVTVNVGWDRTSQSCNNNCHSAARPVWTLKGGAFCGSCHGIPPSGGPHTTTMTLTSCVTCHSQTVDAFGNILPPAVPGGATKHMNGVVDVQ
jgi:predicted CxxxxCH...CXXCH cytochrome family protein